jgi:hypothetical protein
MMAILKNVAPSGYNADFAGESRPCAKESGGSSWW